VKTERSYAVIGAGAIGAFYGARLQNAGFDVHFLLHNDFEYVRDNGITVDSTEGDVRLYHVKAYRSYTDMPACDVVLLTLKATHNAILPEILPRVVKKDGVVIVMQNGLGIEDHVASIAGANRVMGALCFIRSNKIGPGHLRHTGSGYIILADYRPNGQAAGITERLKAIKEDFGIAGLVIKPSEDLLTARWQKLVWNIPYNGLSVVLNAKTDDLMKCESSRSLVLDIMHEVDAAAKACGHPLPDGFVDQMFRYTEAMEPYLTSMKIDFDLKRPMEVEAIVGNPLRAGTEAGACMHRIEMLYHLLKYIDQYNSTQV
jgi:2-dehydropantoate 2-reductase